MENEIFEESSFRQTIRAELSSVEVQNMIQEIKKYQTDYDARDIYKILGGKGLLAPNWSEEFGGMGFNFNESAVLMEEFSNHGVPEQLYVLSILIVGNLLYLNASEEQKKRYLPSLASGEKYSVVLYSEPRVGSNLSEIETKAELDEFGFYRITGRKVYSMKTHLADYGLCAARTSKKGSKYDGITVFMVPLDSEGVTVTPINSLSDEALYDVSMHDVQVSKDDIVGNLDEGWSIINKALSVERTGIDYYVKAKRWLNSMMMKQKAQINNASESTIVELSKLNHKLNTSRLWCNKIFNSLDYSEDIDELTTAISKWYSSEVACEIAWKNQELFGIEEFLRMDQLFDNPALNSSHSAYREAPGLTLSAGTSEILLETVSKFKLNNLSEKVGENLSHSPNPSIYKGFRKLISSTLQKTSKNSAQGIDDTDSIDNGDWINIDHVLKELKHINALRFNAPLIGEGFELGQSISCILFEELGKSLVQLSYIESANAMNVLTQLHTNEKSFVKELKDIASGESFVNVIGLQNNNASIEIASKGEGWILNKGTYFVSNFKQINESLLIVDDLVFKIPNDSKGIVFKKQEEVIADDIYELTFDELYLTEDNLIHKGFINKESLIAKSRLYQAAYLLGLAKGAMSEAIQYVNNRKQFNKKLIENQSISLELAKLVSELEGVSLNIHYLAWLTEQGKDTSIETSQVLASIAELALETSRKSIHYHGAFGMTKLSKIEKFYRLIALESIKLGTPNDLWLESGKLILTKETCNGISEVNMDKKIDDYLTTKLKRLPINSREEIMKEIRLSLGFVKKTSTLDEVTFNEHIPEESTPSEEISLDIEVDLSKSYELSNEEYNLLINDWGLGERREFTDMAVHELFESQAIKTPQKIAAYFDDYSISYVDLNNRSNQLANLLLERGICKETPVAIYINRSIDMIVNILAVLKCGGYYIPLDPNYPTNRIKDILDDSAATVIITNDKFANSLVGFNIDIVNLDQLQSQINNNSIENLQTEISSNQLAYAIYTSGSTGKPKGVLIEHKSLNNFILSIVEKYEIVHHDVIMQFSSIGFDVSVFDIFTALTQGATLCIANENERISPELLQKKLMDYSVTVAELPPAILPNLSPNPLLDLRLISVGGERFSGDLVNKWATKNRRFVNGYGPTEGTVAVTLYDCYGNWTKTPPIGKPIHNVEVYVLNEKQEPVPIGVAGELYIGGKCLARGYLNKPEITKDRFLPNPFSKEENTRIYKTGDLVRWLPNGNLEILGRTDRQIKIRGFRVELSEIESVILEDKEVINVTVQLLESDTGSKQLIAYVISHNISGFIADDLLKNLKMRLPKYMVPSRIIEISEMPLTINGKIDTEKLPKPDDSRPMSSDFEEPETEIERKLCNHVFSSILGISKVGVLDNFFDLGGNSLQATSVVSQARNLFGVNINLIDFFNSPTARGLSKLIYDKEIKNINYIQSSLSNELDEIEVSWINIHHVDEPKYRIVCFPYAGASSNVFKDWPEILAPDIEVITIELPGHGTRIKETPLDDCYEIANHLASALEELADIPLIFMGHSGGAILSFETSRILFEKGVVIHHLFALASRAPHAELSEPSRYHLPNDQFLERVNEFKGLSEDLLKNKEVLEMMIPIMRADEKLAETYCYTGELQKFPYPISVYGGKNDRLTEDVLGRWNELTTSEFEMRFFEGGHFFLKDDQENVLMSLIDVLSNNVQ